MTQNSEPRDVAVRDLIDRLFDDVEPPHRAGMAEASIAHGASAVRRRGYLVAGATLGVVAVAAGAVAVGGRISGGGEDWSLPPGPAGAAAPGEFEDPQPSYSDKMREIETQLPVLLGPLLPAGVTVRHDPSRMGPMNLSTGDISSEFLLRRGAREVVLQVDSDPQGFERPGGTPVAVAGGSFRMWTTGTGAYGSPGFTNWFLYTPADTAESPIRIMIYGNGKDGVLDASDFTKLLNAPGFKAVSDLLDQSKPAGAAAVRQRYQIEDRIDAETAAMLPPGYRLKLSPASPDRLELVGPQGVNGFDWYYFGPGELKGSGCSADVLCYRDENQSSAVGPDGKPRLGTYTYTFGTDGGIVSVTVASKPGLGASIDPLQEGKATSETAPLGPGLTPQEAMAIVRTPGLAKIIEQVRQASSL